MLVHYCHLVSKNITHLIVLMFTRSFIDTASSILSVLWTIWVLIVPVIKIYIKWHIFKYYVFTSLVFFCINFSATYHDWLTFITISITIITKTWFKHVDFQFIWPFNLHVTLTTSLNFTNFCGVFLEIS